MRLLTAGSLVRVQLEEPEWPVGQAVKTPPFHGGNTSSILVRVTNKSELFAYGRWVRIFVLWKFIFVQLIDWNR